MVTRRQPLHLSTFTLDEFEHAIRHAVDDPPCSLLAEVHSTLIYNLRTVPFHRHSAVLSLLRARDLEDNEVLGNDTDALINAMADIGNNWERVPLRFSEGRVGWEDALLGCLKDVCSLLFSLMTFIANLGPQHATVANFPRLREILTKLLFAPEETAPSGEGNGASSEASGSRSPPPSLYTVPSTPAERYPSLPPADRIAIMSFMTNLAITSKAIHAHMESCEEQLTALRKEKIEVNRSKKQL